MEKRILIVDDEKNIRTTLNYCLLSEGYEIDFAVNGKEAIEILIQKEKKYDLILLDIKMPGINGMEVLRRLRACKNNTEIIMMTAYGSIKEAVEAIKLNAVDFIGKPFTPTQIKELIKKVFSREELKEKENCSFEELIELAKLYITNGNLEKSKEILEKAVSKNVNSPETYNLLGVIAESVGNTENAQKQYRASLAFNPSYEPAICNLERVTNAGESKDFNLG